MTAERLLADPFRRGLADLQHLSMRLGEGDPFWGAGAPWFMALFGRDLLVTSLMGGIAGSGQARGGLEALARYQSHVDDAFRDAEPGKIAHELRRGELAFRGKIPHTPYYGTYDAPALFALALWNATRWTGDGAVLDRYLPAAISAMDWCDRWGDQDGDGFLEYSTRSRRGYRNQGWKDSGDAVPHEDGALAENPVGTVELQGYWYAARLAMAEMLERAGRIEEANLHRERAHELRSRIEDRFWMEDRGFYAFAMDRDKRLVRSIASNPGHLLLCGVSSLERARQVTRRMLDPDLFSGYGIRTLSTEHRCYNPLSYQVGSVWPHDTTLVSAGMMRYGFFEEASRMLEGLLTAATAYEENRLPELFCGFPRSEGSPVPYVRANAPQAWAAASPLLMTQLFLGLVPDAPQGKCYLDPRLPSWLPTLEVERILVRGEPLDVRVIRDGSGGTEIEYARHPSLEIVAGSPATPLWGGRLENSSSKVGQ